MKEGIHPKYVMATVTCACGNTFMTRSTKPKAHIEICANCHPFYTGKQKMMDAAGRVEKFKKRFEKTSGKTVRVAAKTKAAKNEKVAERILTTTARIAATKKVVDKRDEKKSAAKKAAK